MLRLRTRGARSAWCAEGADYATRPRTSALLSFIGFMLFLIPGCRDQGPVEAPEIALSLSSLAFEGTAGAAEPAVRAIAVTNGGTGELTGLSATVSYATGQPNGWLVATLGTTAAPATLTVRVTTGSLEPGSYGASITVAAPGVAHSPIGVTFTVMAARTPPAIALSPTGVTFTATAGGASPAAQSVSVSNAGGGTLSGLTHTVAYQSGQPTGWLTAALSSTSAPSTLTLTAATGTLVAGTYNATVSVASPLASNSPRTVSVTFTVTAVPTPPAIALSPTGVTFTATAGGASPAAQSVSISNAGGGTLSGLTHTVAYQSGQPTGWLTAALSSTSAPSTLTLTAATGTLVAGTYNATVSVASPLASNSPRTVSVTFTVTAVPTPPAIALSPTGVTFTATAGGASPAAQSVSISNAGGGTLSGLTHTVAYQSGQPTGWLTAALSSTSAPSTLTLTAATGTLVAGTYNATVSVASPLASNSPRTVSVTFTVTAVPTPPAIALSPTGVTFTATAGGASPAAQSVSISNAGGGTLSGLTHTVAYQSGQPTGWLTAALSSTSAPSSLTLTAATGTLVAGTYNATVSVASPLASNSPRTVSVTFTVMAVPTPPAIALSPTGVTFTATAGGASPAAQSVSISNAGGGTLSGLTHTVAYQSGQPTGWLTAALSSTSAPSTLTLTAATGTLAAGTYNATVSVASPLASNSPRTVSVTFTIGQAAGAPSLSMPTVSGMSITLTWSFAWPSLAGSADGYSLEQSSAPTSGFAQVVFYPVRSSPYTTTLTRSPGTYYFRVRARTYQGFSSYSEVRSATVSAPSELTAFASADNLLAYNSLYPNREANTVAQSGPVAVGCFWAIGPFVSSFLCYQSALMFTVQSQIAGRSIQSAVLRLWPSSLAADVQTTYAVNAYAGPWNPATITLANQPAQFQSGQSNRQPPITTALPLEFDVTTIVRNWAAGTWATNGVLLHDLSGTFPSISLVQVTEFYSLETFSDSSKRPQLYIVFGP